jgi:isoleucyl-tRNA synthetase
LTDKDVADVSRKLNMVWNMFDFFTLYADVDKWEWDGVCEDPYDTLENTLDQWIVSRLHQLIEEVDTHMQRYDVPNAAKPILPFIDDASNWYVRRSRKRFWKSEDDSDKNDAYRTLHYVLVRLAYVMAPFTPFLAEELYRKLTGDESVHLQDWPEVGHVNELLIQDMASARTYITDGLALRAKAGIKVRQPLASASVPTLPELYQEIIAEELNVKRIVSGTSVELDMKITPELKREGLMREVVRQVQSARKAAGLQVDDHIALTLETEDKLLRSAIHEHEAVIKQETLSDHLTQNGPGDYHTEVKVEGIALTIQLTPVS